MNVIVRHATDPDAGTLWGKTVSLTRLMSSLFLSYFLFSSTDETYAEVGDGDGDGDSDGQLTWSGHPLSPGQ